MSAKKQQKWVKPLTKYQGKSNFCWNFERLCSIYGRIDPTTWTTHILNWILCWFQVIMVVQQKAQVLLILSRISTKYYQ